MNRIFQFAGLALAAALVAGCGSTQAAVERTRFAMESEYALTRNLEGQRRISLHHIDQNMRHELARLDQVLVLQNARAGNNTRRVAQNYIDYFAALEALRSRVAEEYAVVASLHAEGVAIGRGFATLSDMASAELTIASATAMAAINESQRAAQLLWAEYQRQNPTPVPDPKPEPAPVDKPEGEGEGEEQPEAIRGELDELRQAIRDLRQQTPTVTFDPNR